MSDEQGFFLSIASLIDDFKSSSVSSRLNSMQSLKTIAAALGPERTRNELLPYVSECIEDSDDVLSVLAEELGTMVDYIGGLEHSNTLLRILEILCSGEDVVVREKAASSLNSLANMIYKATGNQMTAVQQEYYSMVGRMSRADNTGSRATSSSLFPNLINAFSKLGRTKTIRDMLATYATLSKDAEPQVRRGVAVAYGAMVEAVRHVSSADASGLTSEFLHPVFVSIAQDAQDGIKLLAFDMAISLANPKITSDAIQKLTENPAWRVRYMGAHKLSALSSCVLPQTLMDITTKLLSDSEAEVRATAVCQLSNMTSYPAAFLTKSFNIILKDSNPFVRSSMVGLLGTLADAVPASDLKDVVVPLMQVPSSQQDIDTTLLLVQQLPTLAKVASQALPNGMTTLNPLLNALSGDSRWRVRERFAEIVPSLFPCIPKESIDSVVSLVVPSLLLDRVQAVRATSTLCWAKIITLMGQDWGRRVAIPVLSEKLLKSNNYLHRVTGGHACRDIILANSQLSDAVLPLLRQLSNDAVPNVRIAVCDALTAFVTSKIIDETRVVPMLSQLASDKDDDVSKAAKKGQSLLR